jgi:hypothetical protein
LLWDSTPSSGTDAQGRRKVVDRIGCTIENRHGGASIVVIYGVTHGGHRVGGASFIAKNFLVVVAPQHDLPYVIFPMFLAMASLTLWLLIKGIDRARWDEMQTVPANAGR